MRLNVQRRKTSAHSSKAGIRWLGGMSVKVPTTDVNQCGSDKRQIAARADPSNPTAKQPSRERRAVTTLIILRSEAI
jgi:hypothetical protein